MNDPEEGMDEIALRELVATLRTQLKSLEGDCAVMRHELEIIQNWPSRFWAEKGLTSMTIAKALSTSAGKSILDKLEGYEKRLVEAEGLIRDTLKCEDQFFTVSFINRRDAWLKVVKFNE